MERKPFYQAVISLEPFLVKEFKDFESAKKVGCIPIIKKIYAGKHTTRYGNDYEKFNYTFHVDFEQITTSFSINNWSIEDVHEGYCGAKHRVEKGNIKVTIFESWNDYSISDPNGELRIKSFLTPKEAMINLVIFSKYDNWAEYEKSRGFGTKSEGVVKSKGLRKS